MVAHCWRFHPDVLALRDRVAAGELGEVVKTRGYGVHAGWGPSGWFTDPELAGGGALVDMGVHAIDTARFLLGDPRPVRVCAAVGTRYGDYAVDDDAVLLITWDNGTNSVVESGWWQPHLGGLEADTEVYGTGGYDRVWRADRAAARVRALRPADVLGPDGRVPGGGRAPAASPAPAARTAGSSCRSSSRPTPRPGDGRGEAGPGGRRRGVQDPRPGGRRTRGGARVRLQRPLQLGGHRPGGGRDRPHRGGHRRPGRRPGGAGRPGRQCLRPGRAGLGLGPADPGRPAQAPRAGRARGRSTTTRSSPSAPGPAGRSGWW